MGKVISKNRFNESHRRKMSIARKEGALDKIVNGKKLCSKCGKIISIVNFDKSSKRHNKLQIWCRRCMLTEKNASYYAYRKDAVRALAREYTLKSKYGLTLGAYDLMLKGQNGVCAICGKKETQRSNKKGGIDSLRVDHNHKTGNVRGLLCSRCNFGISHFNDEIKLLEKAIDYLLKDQRMGYIYELKRSTLKKGGK